MSLFNKFFGKQELKPADTGIVFGRFTDLNKTNEQLENWENSVSLFRRGNYLESIEALLLYLKGPSESNLTVEKNEDGLQFQIHQGSTLVEGQARGDKFVAEARVFEFDKAQTPLMRKLLEMNFGLQYGSFSMNGNTVFLKFYSHLADASPDKIFYGLKEVSTTSDRQDDLLSSEFKSLKPIGTGHIVTVAQIEKDLKYKFFRQWIESTIKRASELDEEVQQGAISYLFLSLIYKIDYLLKPEGNLLNELEKIQAYYMQSETETLIAKNQKIKEEFSELLQWPKEKVIGDFYNIKATFGIVNPATFQMVADFIFSETEKVKWYRDNNMPEIELAAYEFIIGYCFFNFGMYEPCMKLLHLLMNILNPDFFMEMGFKEEFINADTGTFNQEAIELEINKIMKQGRRRFPHLMFLVSNLKYNSKGDFCASFLKEFDFLNFTNALY